MGRTLAIVSANPGGPLLDRYGRVVGIDAQLEDGTVDADVDIGFGFAIPSSTARTVASEPIAHGQAERPWLGVAKAEPVDSSGRLSDRRSQFAPGDRVRLRVVRGSATHTADVTIGNVPG